MISRIAILVAAGLAFTAPAQAEDAPAIWQGFYLGIFGAQVDATKSGTLIYTDENTGTEYDVMGSKQGLDFDGYQGGVEVGYNWQRGVFVTGLAADLSFGSVDAEKLYTMPGGAYKWQIESQLNSLATLRGKIGVSLGPVLVYGTGGFAIANFQSDKEVTSNDGHPWQTTAKDSATDNHVGFVYGAGAEWMIANGFSLKAEYLHVDLGEEDGQFEGTRYAIKPATGEFPYSSDSFRGDLEMDIIRAGLNYRF